MPPPFVDECVSILKRTPGAMDSLLRDLPEVWTAATEGPGTWSPYDVTGHLVHAEKANWMPRLQRILGPDSGVAFEPFDREAQFRDSQGKSLGMLLDEFSALRRENLRRLHALDLQPQHLEMQGIHPALGTVTARQLLAAWTAHDLAHMVQVSRVMARRLKQDTGPWAEYLSLMK